MFYKHLYYQGELTALQPDDDIRCENPTKFIFLRNGERLSVDDQNSLLTFGCFDFLGVVGLITGQTFRAAGAARPSCQHLHYQGKITGLQTGDYICNDRPSQYFFLRNGEQLSVGNEKILVMPGCRQFLDFVSIFTARQIIDVNESLNVMTRRWKLE